MHDHLAKGIESTSKPIVVDGVIYPSSAEAGRVLGVSCPLFRLRSPNFPNWNYLSDIEKTMNNEDKKETTVSQQLNKDTLLKKIHQGMVVYCDGGSRSGTNKGGPGYGGFGIHGYLYKDDDVKKEAGNPDHVLTVGGYVSKKDYNADPTSYIKVEPLHYIDGVGSFGNLVTNNYAELHAAINTLRHALDYDIVRILIVGDSQYVIKGMNEYAETWRTNHWRKGDGEEVKNVDLWKELVMLRDQLQQRGVEVTFQWVKAHHDELGNVGNVIADKYATIGVMTSIGGVVRIEIDTTPASGYWKNDLSKHPLLCLPRMYFNTAADTIRSGEYYLGNHGKEDDMLGKRISDGCYAVVRLKENDKVLDTVIQDAIERSGMTDSIMIVHLDQLFRSEVYQDVHRHGAFAYEKANAYRLDTFTLDKQKQLIGRELTSAKLAIRAIESIDFLTQRLDQVLSGDLAQHQLCETDLTPVFYETIVKKKKGEDVNETILKPEYQVGYASLTTPVNYCVPGTMDIKQLDVILTLGIDLPNRNILKQLESKQPSIKVITWMDSPDCFRYATVVTVDDAEAIFCGIYSNLRLIPNSDQ